MRSARVDLPWSMCAMMLKLRMWSSEVTTADCTGSRRGRLTAWRRLIYSMLASLDGYVADERGEFGWAEPDEEVHRFVNDLERACRHVPVRAAHVRGHGRVGRPGGARRRAGLRPRVRRAVARRRQDRVLHDARRTCARGRTRIERGFDPDAVRRLKEAAEHDLAIGGPDLAGQALRAGLVDELRLLRRAGRGRRRHALAAGGRPAAAGPARGAPLRRRHRYRRYGVREPGPPAARRVGGCRRPTRSHALAVRIAARRGRGVARSGAPSRTVTPARRSEPRLVGEPASALVGAGRDRAAAFALARPPTAPAAFGCRGLIEARHAAARCSPLRLTAPVRSLGRRPAPAWRCSGRWPRLAALPAIPPPARRSPPQRRRRSTWRTTLSSSSLSSLASPR